MEINDLIEKIKRAVEPDAAGDVRQEGAAACRAILAALGAEPGQLLSGLPPVRPQPGTAADQLMDLFIGKLRSMLPTDSQEVGRSEQALRIPLAPVPKQPQGGE